MKDDEYFPNIFDGGEAGAHGAMAVQGTQCAGALRALELEECPGLRGGDALGLLLEIWAGV